MRVLIIAHGHPAYSIGGAEVAAHNLFTALNASQGIEAFFLAGAPDGLPGHDGTPLMSLGQSERETFVRTGPWSPFFLSNGEIEKTREALTGYLQLIRPDVVHFHHWIGLGIETMTLVRQVIPNAILIVTLHEYLSICAHHGQMVKTAGSRLCDAASPVACHSCFPEHAPGAFFQRERFIKDHLLLANAFVSPSQFLTDRYAAWGLPRDRFSVIENGLAPQPIAPARLLPPDGRRARFGYFGQLSEFKGLHVLLEAITAIDDALWGRDAALCLFGGNLENQPDSFRHRFDRLIERAGRRARFYGAYRSKELPRLMGQVDWLIMPSIWWENSPVVIQEAFLHGRPPIVGDIGGMAEKVRDGIDGLHFRAGSPEDLADRLTEVLHDPDLWLRLRGNAPQPPDLPAFASQHLSLYRRLTRKGRPAKQETGTARGLLGCKLS